MDREQAEALKAEYDAVVAGAADDLIANLDTSEGVTDEELGEQMVQALDEIENSHPWVLDDEKAIVVLQFSNHPTAEFFHHGASVGKECEYGKARFPFGTCAAAALSEDIKDAIRENYGLDGPLTVEAVREAQQDTSE